MIRIDKGCTSSFCIYGLFNMLSNLSEPHREKAFLQGLRPGPDVLKLFSCSTQLGMQFILLINVKMSTADGILTFISRTNAAS